MSALFTALAIPNSDDNIIHIQPPTHEHGSFPSIVNLAHERYIVTLTSVEDKAGTTTAALTLATMLKVLSHQQLDVAVLDMNTANPELFYHTEDKQVNFVSLSDKEIYGWDYLESKKSVTCQGFDCFTVFGDEHPYSNQEGQQLDALLIALKHNYDVIIIDSDAYSHDNPYTMLAMQRSDITLCVSSCTEDTLSLLSDKLNLFLLPENEGGLGLSTSTFGTLLNRNPSGLLATHRLTEELREEVAVVGSIPVLPYNKNDRMKLAALQDEPELLKLGLVTVRNIFTDYNFTK
jgi:hypothetical protein